MPEPLQIIAYDDFERVAMAFVLETETWPVFVAWLNEHHTGTGMADFANSQGMREILQHDWMARSPLAEVKAQGAQLAAERNSRYGKDTPDA